MKQNCVVLWTLGGGQIRCAEVDLTLGMVGFGEVSERGKIGLGGREGEMRNVSVRIRQFDQVTCVSLNVEYVMWTSLQSVLECRLHLILSILFSEVQHHTHQPLLFNN